MLGGGERWHAIVRHDDGDRVGGASLTAGGRPTENAVDCAEGQAGGRSGAEAEGEVVRRNVHVVRMVGEREREALENRLVGNRVERGRRVCAELRDFHVVESRGIERVVIVRADGETDLDDDRHLVGGNADQRPVGAVVRGVTIEVVAVADELDPVGRGVGRSGNIAAAAVVVLAELVVDAVFRRERHQDVGGEVIGGAADHHPRFRPRISGLQTDDAGEDLHVAGCALMDELKRVGIAKNVRAGTGGGETARIVRDLTGDADGTDVLVDPGRRKIRRAVRRVDDNRETLGGAEAGRAVVTDDDGDEVGAG